MKLLKLHLESFKGVRDAEFDLSNDVVTVSGKNGTGKTTLADAWFYLFTDKDYDLQSNPEIHPDFMQESEPSVTAVVELGGKEVTLRKYQTDMRTKKQKEQGAPVRISNKYEINSVPKSQKDFVRTLSEAGVDMDRLLLLTHTEVFTGQKVADERKILFEMATDKTDADVAALIPECADAVSLFDKYTMEEIVATNKSSLKKSKDMIESIPNQIIGMEKSKVQVDPSLGTRKCEIETHVETLTVKMKDAEKASDSRAIDAEIRRLEAQKVEAYNTANADRLNALSEAQSAYNKAYSECSRQNNNMFDVKHKGNDINTAYRDANIKIKAFEGMLKQISAEKFTGRTVCPTCGQALPKDKVAEAKANWQADKDARLAKCQQELNDAKALRDSKAAEGKELAKVMRTLEKTVDKAKKILEDAEDEVDKHSYPVTPDTSEIDTAIADAKRRRDETKERVEEVIGYKREIDELNAEREEIIRKQAAELNNSFIDENIANLKDELKRYAQVKADAEKVLWQMQLISFKKNELLSDEINSHFTKVKFRLFQIQKNGEVKDDCTPLVLCSDGEYRDMTYSANTAAIVAAKLDICAGLQKFYGQDLPIWLDGAECLDENNRKALDVGRQLILLCVSEDKELVVE